MAKSWLVAFVALTFTASVLAFDFPEPPNYPWTYQTELDKYVWAEDGEFKWEVIEEYDFENVTLYIVNMTSQKWIDETFSDHPIWWHYMGIAVPKKLTVTHIAALFIMGGGNDDDPPPPIAVEAVAAMQLATDTGSVAAFLKMVPNQPIRFYDDPEYPRGRTEDRLIAWSWVMYGFRKGTPLDNPGYPLRCPMTKSGKRALDTITEFGKQYINGININKFFVSGASKRGWTVWSLAATDRRVVAINPMVFSLIHMEESVMNHYRALGGAWSFALEPYWNENLTQYMLSPIAWGEGGLYDYEDIYRYRSRLTIPKLSIAATGDEFFFPQDFHPWWDDFPEPKLLMMLPNADHVMAPHYFRMYDTLLGFYENIIIDGGSNLPKLSWTYSESFDKGGEIILHTVPTPRIDEETGWYDIEGWKSITEASDDWRDFRMIIGSGPRLVRWNTTWVDEVAGQPGYFVSNVDVDYNAEEWVGHFIETTYDGPSGRPMYLTTGVNYVPFDYFPAPPCLTDAECYGQLV